MNHQASGGNCSKPMAIRVLIAEINYLLQSRLRIFKRKFTLKMMLLASFVVIQGCSSTAVRPVSESNKDTTGTYDGRWIGTVSSTSRQQRYGNTIFNCGDRTGNKYLLVVRDGEISVNNRKESSYINSSGNFRVKLPTTMNVTSDSAGSSVGALKASTIVSGSMEKKSGSVFEAVGAAGCRSLMNFERN